MKNQPKQFANTALGAFCAKYDVPLSQLSKLCENASRSTMHRLLHNELAPDYRKKLIKILAGTLPAFLLSKGLSPSDVDFELIQILNGDYQPMISQRIELTPEECRWFGFKDREGKPVDPFTNAPQSKDEVFVSPGLQHVIDRVVDAVRYQSFVCVTGDIGSGKSTLRALIEDHVAENENLVIVWPEFFDMRWSARCRSHRRSSMRLRLIALARAAAEVKRSEISSHVFIRTAHASRSRSTSAIGSTTQLSRR
jgi:hypothetical protein